MSTPRDARRPQRLDWLRSLLGIRGSLTVGSVRYKELSPEPLARALSRRGSGAKEYTAHFPGGRRMRITVTPSRAYEDINGPALLSEYRLAEPSLRPGMRVVALRSGTGYAAAWLANIVGPSGSVVALDPDGEAIRYARWRYRFDNVSFEVGDHTALAGEIDGTFDAALAIHALRDDEDAGAVLVELWRALAPGGSLIATAPAPPANPADHLRAFTADELAALLIAPATREAATHRAALKEHDANQPDLAEVDVAPAAPRPPAPPPNPEVRILPALPAIAAVAVRKAPVSAA